MPKAVLTAGSGCIATCLRSQASHPQCGLSFPAINLAHECSMTLFWIVFGFVILVVLGNALVLLRTAKKPRLPAGVKPQPYEDDDA